MNREKFILICTKCGYCSKRFALLYAKDKSELTENDFIEVFRLYERLIAVSDYYVDERFSRLENGRTTRKIIDEPSS